MPQTEEQKQLDRLIATLMPATDAITSLTRAANMACEHVHRIGMGWVLEDNGIAMAGLIEEKRHALADYDDALARLQNLMWAQSPVGK